MKDSVKCEVCGDSLFASAAREGDTVKCMISNPTAFERTVELGGLGEIESVRTVSKAGLCETEFGRNATEINPYGVVIVTARK